MKFFSDGLDEIDPRLQPCYWLNKDQQLHFFESTIENFYPGFPESQKTYVAKPGAVTLLPHQYLKVSSRDGTPIKGAWVLAEAAEDYAKSSFKIASHNS